MRFLTTLFIALFLVGCSSKSESDSMFQEKTIAVGSKQLFVQIAQTPEAREHGLMYREKIKPYAGMLFVFRSPQPVTFWMKNTPLPLEVGYIDNQGILLEIHELTPMSTQKVRSIAQNILYALELPKGDFTKYDIKVGDKLFIP